MKHEEQKIRTLKVAVEQNSERINKIVNQVVAKHSNDLDEFMVAVKALLDKKETLSNTEIEDIVLRIPVYIYFSAEGLESLGVEGDTAKAVKMEAFNEVYMVADGTIQDKTKVSEVSTVNEYMVEVVYTRAYKKLKARVEKAEHLFSGAKKILSKRMAEYELSNQEQKYKSESGLGESFRNTKKREERSNA